MTSLAVLAILLCSSAVLGVVNRRLLGLPPSIGVLVLSFAASVLWIGVDHLFPRIDLLAGPRAFLHQVDLPRTLLGGALSCLLFAGAMQVDLGDLRSRQVSTVLLSVPGTVLAVLLFGGAMWWVLPLCGARISFAWCVVLGAILAPTDPVSVVGMLRRVGLPGPMQALFAGESLFNDGVGVVVFGVALPLAVTSSSAVPLLDLVRDFGVEALGGAAFGLVTGWIGLNLHRLAADHHLDVLVSLALATGTYAGADGLGLSGPIAVVVAGLWMGSGQARRILAGSRMTLLHDVWTTIDETLNVLLFLLIGLEVFDAVPGRLAWLGLLAGIPLALMARGLSVLLATFPMHVRGQDRGRALVVLTWGGLRGGISVSLVLGLPPGPVQALLVPICYGIVVFSIVVQGLTMERVASRAYPEGQPSIK